MKNLFIIHLLIFTSTAFAVKHPKAKIEFNPQKISSHERKVANNFLHLYKLAQSGKASTRLLGNLKKDIIRSSNFSDYKLWVEGAHKLSSKISYAELKQYCTKLSQKEVLGPTKKKLNNNLIHLCFKSYLDQTQEKIEYTVNFHKLQNKYIKTHISRVVGEEHGLTKLLYKLRPNPKLHKLYSQTVAQYLIMKDLTPSHRLLEALFITPDLTRYLQTKELDSKKSQYGFLKELLKQKNKTEKALDDKLDEKVLASRFAKLIDYYIRTYEFQLKDRSTLNMISLGKDFTRAKRYKYAQSIFRTVLTKVGHSYQNQGKFELMWTYILQKDYKGADKHVVEKYIVKDKDLEDNSQLAFWTAIVLENSGKKVESELILRAAIKNNPLSYYAILASKKLSGKSALVANDIYLTSLAKNKRSVASYGEIDNNWLTRVYLWGELNSYSFLKLEIESKEGSKNFEKYIVKAAHLLSKSQNYLESFKVILNSLRKNHIAFDKDLLQILFPTPYFHEIKTQTNNDFDPIIALSLIRQESGFNKRARSRVGARGLMQLMPATARRFKRRLKNSHLYNPSTNISIGTKYFNKLLARYDNNLVYSLAAYNAGEHRVDRWQNDFLTNDSILKDIENIPYTETRKYVKLIFRNIFFYKLLLNGKKNDKSKYNQIYDIHLGFNR